MRKGIKELFFSLKPVECRKATKLGAFSGNPDKLARVH